MNHPLFIIIPGVFALLVLTGFRLKRIQTRRERGLAEAIRERTEELEAERVREGARGKVLEMLASNESLGTVLDSVANLIRTEIPGALSAVLLKKAAGWDVAAAPGVPLQWIKALAAPHAVPFEVWKEPSAFDDVAENPAWRSFMSKLEGPRPDSICSYPVGAGQINLGAVLVFNAPGAISAPVVASAARLAQLAVEHSRLYEDLSFQAHHDSLTGLPNRILFHERLARGVRESESRQEKLAILFIDLDHFKEVNDRLNHRTGDLLLAQVADRMRRVVRPGDTVARIGGDEFNVLLSNIGDIGAAEEIGARILKALWEPFHLEGAAVDVSASIGIAIFPDDGSDPEQLQRDADAAMYCAKGMGRNRVQSFSTRNETLDRVRMEQDLRTGLRNNQFEVYYQPKIGADGHFGGLEALLRFNHPVYGQVPPVQFIPVAEESGFIVQLGAWVVDEVCRQIAEWRSVGLGQICVAVNVSARQIVRPDFAVCVREALNRHGVPPWNLELELTESLLISGGDESQIQMRDLRGLGIRFSLDDFGTGYSSLSYLHKLPVDCIKLDRSFVQCIDTDQAARRLVQAMIGVAHGLGLSVVAEGVETEEQREVLIAAGCPMMQGYLFARPSPAAQIAILLRDELSDLDRLGRSLRVSAEPVAV